MLKITTFDSESALGYKQITTFWMDFSVAENFGNDAIIDTYNRAFNEWKTNYKYLTELVMILNWKIGQWYGKDDERAEIYDTLFKKADAYACDNLKGDELDYFYQTTD